MPPPATLRLWGSCLGYLGIALALIWIAQLIWLQGGLMAGGSLLDTLAQVNPMLWLVIPLAGLPGFLIHLAGDKIEAQQRGISIREVQFRRHLRLRHHAADKDPLA